MVRRARSLLPWLRNHRLRYKSLQTFFIQPPAQGAGIWPNAYVTSGGTHIAKSNYLGLRHLTQLMHTPVGNR